MCGRVTVLPTDVGERPLGVALRFLRQLEVPWLLLLALPITLPGYFVPLRYTPTVVLLLFVFWPLHAFTMYEAWRAGYRRSPVFAVAIVLLLCTLGVSLSVTVDIRYAWLMAGHLALGIALCVALVASPLAQRRPLLAAWFPAGAILGVALLLSAVGPPLLAVTMPSARAISFFAAIAPLVSRINEPLNPNILAGGLLLAMPLCFALALAPWSKSERFRLFHLLRSLVFILLAWWLLQVLFLTQSRGALAAALLTVPLLLVLRWPRITGAVLLVAGAGLIWLFFNDPMAQLNAIMANGMARDYNSRMEIWVRSARAFSAHALTGIGIGSFIPVVVDGMLPIRVPLTAQVTHAHNLFLQVAVDLGLFGLLAYTTLLLSSAHRALRAWHRHSGLTRALAAGTLAALLTLTLHGMVDAPLWNSKLAFLPWLLIALAHLLAVPDGVPHGSRQLAIDQ